MHLIRRISEMCVDVWFRLSGFVMFPLWGIIPCTKYIISLPSPLESTALSPSWQVLPSLIWTPVLSNWHSSHYWSAAPFSGLLDACPLMLHNGNFLRAARQGRILVEVPLNRDNSKSTRTTPNDWVHCAVLIFRWTDAELFISKARVYNYLPNRLGRKEKAGPFHLLFLLPGL